MPALAPLLCCVLALLGAAPGARSVAQEALGSGPHAEMSALLEATIFNIDVLTLTVRVSPETAARLGALVEGRRYGDDLADSVAAVILRASPMWARQRFHRDVGFDRFLGGMLESNEQAADAGFVSTEYADAYADSLPIWFAFLREGAKEDDEIVSHVRGDTVRTVYRTAEGRVLFDRVRTGPEARRGSIPSFFAPGSHFRKRLVESLIDPNASRR